MGVRWRRISILRWFGDAAMLGGGIISLKIRQANFRGRVRGRGSRQCGGHSG